MQTNGIGVWAHSWQGQTVSEKGIRRIVVGCGTKGCQCACVCLYALSVCMTVCITVFIEKIDILSSALTRQQHAKKKGALICVHVHTNKFVLA